MNAQRSAPGILGSLMLNEPIFKKVGRQRIGLNPAVPSTTLFQWMADLAFRLVQLALDKEGRGRIVCGALLMSLGKWAN